MNAITRSRPQRKSLSAGARFRRLSQKATGFRKASMAPSGALSCTSSWRQPSANRLPTRELAYEKLGDRAKAAASYTRAIDIRPKDEAARTGMARVGG